MKPARRVDDVDFVEEIRNDLLPLRSRGSEIDVEIAQQQRFTVGGAGSPGGAEVIHSRRVSGVMYAPITKYHSSPVTSWNVRRLGKTMVTASTSKS